MSAHNNIHAPHRKQQGFTLVELSIVIVIISLIIAGVTAGQSLVKASQLRSIITDVQSIQASVNAFKLQYNTLPGDMPNASAYWTCPNNSSDNLNCNGNGNKQIDYGTGGNGGGYFNNEIFRSWQHLKLAGVLPNIKADGLGNNADSTLLPVGRLSNSVYFMAYRPTQYFQRAANALVLAGYGGNAIGNGVDNLTPIMAQSIDAKMDDGVANKGKMYGIDGGGYTYGAACSWGGATAGQDYKMDMPGPCQLVWFIF